MPARQRRARRALANVPGSSVNDHVARFVVWGKHAAYLISRQPWNYAFGQESALERFVELGGKILLLGCDHDTVTFLHYAEHIVDIPDKRVARFKVPVSENGARVWRDMEEFDTSERAHRELAGSFLRPARRHLSGHHGEPRRVRRRRAVLRPGLRPAPDVRVDGDESRGRQPASGGHARRMTLSMYF